MQKPSPSEEYIIITDNKGRTQVQRVEYIVLDVKGDKIYVTVEGLNYTEDSLDAKDFHYLIEQFDKIPAILSRPDIVIHDYGSPQDTLIYYKQLRIAELGIHQLIAVVVKQREGMKFFYNMHPQQSGSVKGYHKKIFPQVWYIAPNKKYSHFGLRQPKT